MSEPQGRTTVFYRASVSIAPAEVVEVQLRPPNMELWHVVWAEGQQDDGDVMCGWKWYDPQNPAGVQLHVTSVSANLPLPFGALAPSEQGPGAISLPITNSRYPAYFFVASGATKTGVVVAIIVEQVGAEGSH
ncbi:unnamed protein product [marine sediment metagenome]|uniref:Uncharacterized protein n=1 Tax=marine sediment metagenome TaxID=412755 RepID=X1SQK2_9ZZZZ